MDVHLIIHLKTAEDRIRAGNDGRMRRLSGPEMLAMIEGQRLILDKFTNTWPVRTGRSKAGWQVQLKTRGQLGYVVFNDVEYTSWVFRADEGPDPLYPQLEDQANAEIVDNITDTMAVATDAYEVAKANKLAQEAATASPGVKVPEANIRSRRGGASIADLAMLAPLLKPKKRRRQRAGS